MKVNGSVSSERLSAFVALGLGRPGLVFLLAKAAREHRRAEEEFGRLLACYRHGENAQYPSRSLGPVEYFERNFFSILMLSIFISLRIPHSRRLLYGVTINSLRTIVTCSDNILDSEYKGMVFLNPGLGNAVLDNTVLLLMADKVMSKAVRSLGGDQERTDRIEAKLMDSLAVVAAGESGTQYTDDMPEPDNIITHIHQRIGGELLALALVAPEVCEETLTDRLSLVRQGIVSIGTALQMLDDVTDIETDMIAHKANLLASHLLHTGPARSFDDLLKLVTGGSAAEDENFQEARVEVIQAAIGKALAGFDMLAETGYPMDHSDARAIVKAMFQLRGLGNEWQATRYA